MPRKSPASKRWAFTLNNPTDQSESKLRSLAEQVQYIIWGKEIAPGTGTPHLQGYLELTSKKTIRGLKKLIGVSTVHLEIAKGSLEQNQTYCKKDGQWKEFGSPMKQGSRSDLDSIKDEIKAGATEAEVAEKYFSRWVVYRRSFSAYRELQLGKRDWKTIVVLLVGPTGVGKTRFVFDQCMDRDIYVWGGDRWFDGYCGQEIALIDDFEGSGLEYKFLLRLLDRYPMQVPIKGGFVNWAPKKVYITSNELPDVWRWNPPQYDVAALKRRITITHVLDNPIY